MELRPINPEPAHRHEKAIITFSQGAAGIYVWEGPPGTGKTIAPSVMKTAVVGDIQRWAAKGPLWHCPHKKALNCKTIKAENLSHFKEVSNLAPLFRVLTKGKRSHEKLFPNSPAAVVWRAHRPPPAPHT